MPDSAHSMHFRRSSVKNSDGNAEAAWLTQHSMHFHRNVLELFLDTGYKYELLQRVCMLLIIMDSGGFVSIALIYA